LLNTLKRRKLFSKSGRREERHLRGNMSLFDFHMKGLQIVFGLTGNTVITLLNVIFITWKLFHVSYVFFHIEFKYVIRIALFTHSFCVTEFFKMQF
jgi:hypothetical protein